MHAKPGDRVEEGQVLMTLLTDDTDRFARAEDALVGSYDVGADARHQRTLILDKVE